MPVQTKVRIDLKDQGFIKKRYQEEASGRDIRTFITGAGILHLPAYTCFKKACIFCLVQDSET